MVVLQLLVKPSSTRHAQMNPVAHKNSSSESMQGGFTLWNTRHQPRGAARMGAVTDDEPQQRRPEL